MRKVMRPYSCKASTLHLAGAGPSIVTTGPEDFRMEDRGGHPIQMKGIAEQRCAQLNLAYTIGHDAGANGQTITSLALQAAVESHDVMRKLANFIIEKAPGDKGAMKVAEICSMQAAKLKEALVLSGYIDEQGHVTAFKVIDEPQSSAAVEKALRELLTAVTFKTTPVDFGEGNPCYEARVPVQFVEDANNALTPAKSSKVVQLPQKNHQEPPGSPSRIVLP